MNLPRYVRTRLQSALLTGAYVAVLAGLLCFSAWLVAGALGVLLMSTIVASTLLVGSQLPIGMLMRLRRAQPLPRSAAPALHATVASLAQRAGLRSSPALYYVPSPQLQAFTVGTPEQGAIAVTQGLFQTLSAEELRGVMAHEISHLASGDTRLMGLAASMGGLLRSLGSMAWLLLLLSVLSFGTIDVSLTAVVLVGSAPIIAPLLEMGLSRTREFNADARAVELTGSPAALARALWKLERWNTHLNRRLGPLPALAVPHALRTHPATEQRIHRLRELATDFQPESRTPPPSHLGSPLTPPPSQRLVWVPMSPNTPPFRRRWHA